MKNFNSSDTESDNGSENLNDTIFLLLTENGHEIDPENREFIVQRVIDKLEHLDQEEIVDVEVLDLVDEHKEEIFNPIGSIEWMEYQ